MPPLRRSAEIEDFFRTIEAAFSDIDRKLQSGFADEVDFRSTVTLLEQIRLNVHRLRTVISENDCRSFLETLDNLLSAIQRTSDPLGADQHSNTNTAGLDKVQGPRGPPAFDIGRERLLHLIHLGYTVTSIAKMGLLGKVMHRNTVINHMRKHGLQCSRHMYGAADEDVREVIKDYTTSHPNAGFEEVRAFLTTREPPIHIARHRVRAIVSDTDPEGVALRWRSVIQRRQYAVPGPNSLWHVDGHHKMFRYKIYIHGGIDGYSRLIPYLRASSYNSSIVAFSSFISGVLRCCIPSRVRMDDGVENGLIKRFMEAANGDGRGSAIQGKSVHNQRIERLWRDVHLKVVSMFLNILSALEESRALDIENEVQLFCAQFVVLPALNLALEEWRVTHNHHKVRTAGHRTPEQLWFTGMAEQREHDTTAVRNVVNDRDCVPICHQVLPDFDIVQVNMVEKFNVPKPCQFVPENIVTGLIRNFGVDGVKIEHCIDFYGAVLTHVCGAISVD